MTAPTCQILPLRAIMSIDRLDRWAAVLTPGAPARVVLWDTFDQALRRTGRVLWEAEGRLGLATGDQVLTQPATRQGNFVANLAPGPVREALSDLSPLRCLLPLAEGNLTETRLALTDDLAKTCARAELRDFAVGRGALHVRLMPLRGYDRAAEALRGLFAGLAVPGPLAHRLIDAPLPSKPRVEIAASDTAFDAALRLVAAHLPGLRSQEPGILADHDTEFLHQYRIGLRKIRLTLGLFDGVLRTDRAQDLRLRFSSLMQATGRLRDLDVALLTRDAAYASVPPSLHEGLDQLYAGLALDRAHALEQMRQHLRGPGYASEVAALTRLLDKPRHLAPGKLADVPARELALRLMRARHRKIVKATALLTPDTPDEELHLIRLHLKKLRYLMEFFAPHLPPVPYRTIRKAIRGLQDALGQVNDDAQQGLRLQDALGGQSSMALAQSVGALMAVLHARRSPGRAAAMEGLTAFVGPGMVATFQALILETP